MFLGMETLENLESTLLLVECLPETPRLLDQNILQFCTHIIFIGQFP